MYISTHTVAHHLRQAFRKLSIASRVELTRIVIEQAADDPGGLPTSTTWRDLRRPVSVIRCRNCSGVLMVISQIRRMTCVDLDGPAALHPGQDG
jgi:hypothetical protein